MTTRPAFTTSEGLRLLLIRLHSAGHAAWRDDPDAAELMVYTMDKYGALARKHGLTEADAAVAAFEVMRTRSAREAGDPWAVVTRAVQLAMTYEARANGMLCSVGRAKRPESAGLHDAERFSDRDTPIHEYHPAFHVQAHDFQTDTLRSDDVLSATDARFDSRKVGEPTNAFVALDRAVEVFIELGWPVDTARTGIEYICNKLMRTDSRPTAFEYLRRDRHARALFDLDQHCWLAMLRAVLGNQHPDREHTAAGRGLLLLLVIDYAVDDVLAMPSIASPISAGVRAMVEGETHA